MHQECRISIITVNYNGLADTSALLESIAFDDPSLEVIVVDNASREDEATEIARRFPLVPVIRSDRNLGFAGGNNLGMESASGQYLYLVNNDAVIDMHDMRSLVDRLESSPHIGMVCPKIRYYFGTRKIQFAGYTPLSPVTMRNRAIGNGESDQGQYDKAHTTPYAHGAAMMVKRDVVKRAGMIPECYFLYYEELDWSVRIREQGYQIWYEPKSTVYHKESQSTGSDSPLRTFYLTRNRLLFARRNVSRPTRFATYAYLMGIVALRDLFRHLSHGRTDLAKAVLKGIHSFIRLT